MRAAKFDTLEYTNNAIQAGFTKQQAEFQVKTLESLAEMLDQGLASKADLLAVEQKLPNKIDMLENKLDSKIITLDAKIATIDSKLTWLVSLFGITGILIGVFNIIRTLH